mmetsp:Transcript_60332/g.112731  ORF Transcript_60332/g.112731 Transcript_60332/m.112731 type:complete len:153 (+) Transcript_60332:73-531(+)
MFRFVATLCLFGLTSALVLTEKPAANASLISEGAQEEEAMMDVKDESAPAAFVENADDVEKAEDKDEIADMKKSDSEGNKLSAAEEKEMAETMKDEVDVKGAQVDEDEIPEDPAVIKAQEEKANTDDSETQDAADSEQASEGNGELAEAVSK